MHVVDRFLLAMVGFLISLSLTLFADKIALWTSKFNLAFWKYLSDKEGYTTWVRRVASIYRVSIWVLRIFGLTSTLICLLALILIVLEVLE